MAELEIVPARASHIWHIARNMREADVAEVRAAGYEPFNALVGCLRTATMSSTAMVDGQPCLMFGVTPISALSGLGSPWMLGTDDARKIRRDILAESRRYVPVMLAAYPSLMNYVDARNTASIRWLRWLGFDIEDAIPYGVNGEPFHKFTMRAGTCARTQPSR